MATDTSVVTTETSQTGNVSKQPKSNPWERAWGVVEDTAKRAVDTVKETVGEPWTKMWGVEPTPLQKPPVEPVNQPKQDSKFETVFSALVNQESRGKHTDASGNLTTSPVGAEGVTQVMPKTAKKPGYGVEPIKNKSREEYLRFGREYLQAMLKEFDGDYEKALAAYNAGAGTVKRAIVKGGEEWKNHLPKRKETIPYINNILGTNYPVDRRRKDGP